MGVRRNDGDSNLLDFVLEGQTNGWVAIGFSKTASMVHFITEYFIYQLCMTGINLQFISVGMRWAGDGGSVIKVHVRHLNYKTQFIMHHGH